MILKWSKKLSHFGRNVWKCRLRNTVTVSFNTTVRQMTEIFQWPKCLSKKWSKCLSAKKTDFKQVIFVVKRVNTASKPNAPSAACFLVVNDNTWGRASYAPGRAPSGSAARGRRWASRWTAWKSGADFRCPDSVPACRRFGTIRWTWFRRPAPNEQRAT